VKPVVPLAGLAVGVGLAAILGLTQAAASLAAVTGQIHPGGGACWRAGDRPGGWTDV